jgi:hypothetical protein
MGKDPVRERCCLIRKIRAPSVSAFLAKRDGKQFLGITVFKGCHIFKGSAKVLRYHAVIQRAVFRS